MTLLTVQGLTVHFRLRRGSLGKSAEVVHAVDGVSFSIEAGETLALVGESGSGKSTVAEAVLQLNTPTAGTIYLDGIDLTKLSRRDRQAMKSRVQIVFQDPYSSLDPRMTVHDLVAEPLCARKRMRATDLDGRVLSLLEMVGLGTQHLWRRPHEFSGGQCQRIAVARALALTPDLVVLDEPTSALDVSIQARILVLLQELKQKLGLAYLLVSHDLAVVESIADKVAVMYSGQLVEAGDAAEVFCRPRHPYTVALLASVPSPEPEERTQLGILPGEVPSAVNPPKGCRFHPRCAYCMPTCETTTPEMRSVDGGTKRACHLPDDTLPLAKARDGSFPAEPLKVSVG
jgi:oligopeptide/dipeptide ABC transporter ATP-binding protein